MRAYAREGFATLVRIRLQDANAAADVEAQIEELQDKNTPPTLVLERIGLLDLVVCTGRS